MPGCCQLGRIARVRQRSAESFSLSSCRTRWQTRRVGLASQGQRNLQAGIFRITQKSRPATSSVILDSGHEQPHSQQGRPCAGSRGCLGDGEWGNGGGGAGPAIRGRLAWGFGRRARVLPFTQGPAPRRGRRTREPRGPSVQVWPGPSLKWEQRPSGATVGEWLEQLSGARAWVHAVPEGE